MISYDDYRAILSSRLAAKSFETHQAFAEDVLTRMLPYLEEAEKDNLWEEEISLLERLIVEVRSGAFDRVIIEQTLSRFEALAREDEDHAIETDSSVIDFLSALDAWIALVCRYDREAAARISESLMNILDFLFTGDTPLSEWLRTPELNREFHRQLEYLDQRS